MDVKGFPFAGLALITASSLLPAAVGSPVISAGSALNRLLIARVDTDGGARGSALEGAVLLR